MQSKKKKHYYSVKFDFEKLESYYLLEENLKKKEMEATENQKKKHIFLSLEELFGKPTQSLKEEFTKFAEFYNQNGHITPPAETYLAVLNDGEMFHDIQLNYIKIYIMESPLYKHLNEELWKIAKNPENYIPSPHFPKTYFYGLYKALRFLSKTQKPIYNVYNIVVYRNYIIPENFEEILKAGFFIHYGFGSSCIEMWRALEFMKNIPEGKGKGKALLIIHCSPPDLCGYHSPISIPEPSCFKGEKEVIFPPLTLFEIIESRQKENYRNLKLNQQSNIIFSETITSQLKNFLLL